jgi:hypothetical protein
MISSCMHGIPAYRSSNHNVVGYHVWEPFTVIPRIEAARSLDMFTPGTAHDKRHDGASCVTPTRASARSRRQTTPPTMPPPRLALQLLCTRHHHWRRWAVSDRAGWRAGELGRWGGAMLETAVLRPNGLGNVPFRHSQRQHLPTPTPPRKQSSHPPILPFILAAFGRSPSARHPRKENCRAPPHPFPQSPQAPRVRGCGNITYKTMGFSPPSRC